MVAKYGVSPKTGLAMLAFLERADLRNGGEWVFGKGHITTDIAVKDIAEDIYARYADMLGIFAQHT